MCMAVSVASAAKIGQDFSRYPRPCWIKAVLGMFWLGPVWLGLSSCWLSTLSNPICWRCCPGLLLSRGAAVLDHAFLLVSLFSNHHTITLCHTTTSSRSLLILSLSPRACDIIPVQALQQSYTQGEKFSEYLDQQSNLLETD